MSRNANAAVPFAESPIARMLTGGACVFGGGFLGYFAFKHHMRVKRLRTTGIRTHATVVEVEKTRVKDRTKRREKVKDVDGVEREIERDIEEEKIKYTPTYTFITQDGQQFRFTGSSVMSPVYKGDTITIIYDPLNPNSYIEDSWGSTWGATIGLGLLAGLLGAAGLYTFSRALNEKFDLRLPTRNVNVLM